MSDGLSPVVSVGIPIYNAQKYIIDTLESVWAQSYQNIELILYNDCSTDRSYELVAEWVKEKQQRFSNLLLINAQVNRGVGYACDMLLKKSTGTYVQLLGNDDLLYSDKISRQVAILTNNPAYAMAYGNMDRINENGTKIGEDYFAYQNFSTFPVSAPPSGNIFSKLIQENFIPASSVLLRRSVAEEVGGYDTSLKAEDWDLWLRISRKYEIYGEGQVVGAYRILPTSAMHSPKNKIPVLGSLNTGLAKHKGLSKETDKIINEHLYKNTMEMYRLGHISKKWASRLYTYKNGIKPLVYQFLMMLGIKVNQKR